MHHADDSPGLNGYWQEGYKLVLLGACALSLGCYLPHILIIVMKESSKDVGPKQHALAQIDKALHGPHAYQPGEPYVFGSSNLYDTMLHDRTAEDDKLFPNSSTLNTEWPGELKTKVVRELSAGDRGGDVHTQVGQTIQTMKAMETTKTNPDAKDIQRTQDKCP